jgi:hypothetical protein
MPGHGSHDIDRCYQLLSFFHLWDVLQDGKRKVFECSVGVLNRCRQGGPSITAILIEVGPVSSSKESCRLARQIVVSWRISRDNNHEPGLHSRSCELLLDGECEQFR